jgi:RND family efflux transporter MFP subunit
LGVGAKAPHDEDGTMRRIWAAGLLAALALGGCEKHDAPPPDIRPVRSVVAQKSAAGQTLRLTGQIRAQDEVNLAFRLDGRMLERLVSVGDKVTSGQVVARLDAQPMKNALRSAEAAAAAAQAQLTQARNTFERQQKLLAEGFTTRAAFDQAQQALQSAQSQVDSTQAQASTARDQLGYAELAADAAGSVTAVGAEPGEVVRAGAPIVKVARANGRDAVFNVPESAMRTAPRDPVISVALVDDPRIVAQGRVREMSPEADAATRTFTVKVGLSDPPAAMRLGVSVTGAVTLPASDTIELPAAALTQVEARPAVWIVDPAALTVSLRPVEIARYEPGSVVVASGVEPGDVVVTAGAHTLRPGQKVRLLGATP